MNKPTICLDFDGVIHSYEHGWRNGQIYGTVTEGFFEWAERTISEFDLAIHSSRARDFATMAAMQEWFKGHFSHWKRLNKTSKLEFFHFSWVSHKPPAVVYIDDRAIQFNGDWSTLVVSVEALKAFTPWNILPKSN